MNILKRNS